MTDSAELFGLISAKRWPAVIERVRSHPHEVGSSSSLPRDVRGYTALHAVAAYNRASDGRELAPVVRAILRAADEIDCAAAIGAGGAGDAGDDGGAEAVDGSGIDADKTTSPEDTGRGEADGPGGSMRLLLDQGNRASWSPLHLVCVKGGIARGKVPMMKALLQMEGEDREGVSVSPLQHRIPTLIDRQERNILHHLMDIAVPSEDSFDAVHFSVAMTPLLLFQRNISGKTPLDDVLERLLESPGTRKRHHMYSYGNVDGGAGMLANYLMLKLLVDYMDRVVRGWGEVRPRNVLHSACLLPRNCCPSDGSLLTYLCSEDASKLEVEARDSVNVTVNNLASEVDEHGNYALHLFLSNESYAHGSNAETTDGSDATLLTLENNIMAALLNGYRKAISIPNSHGDLPLRIAMKAGRRRAVTALLAEYPEAVFFDDSMLNIMFYVQILGCVSVPPDSFLENGEVDGRDDGSSADDATRQAKVQRRCITIMFNLVRAWPDVTSFAGSGTPESNEEVAKSNERSKDGSLQRKKKKKWWSNISIFS